MGNFDRYKIVSESSSRKELSKIEKTLFLLFDILGSNSSKVSSHTSVTLFWLTKQFFVSISFFDCGIGFFLNTKSKFEKIAVKVFVFYYF